MCVSVISLVLTGHFEANKFMDEVNRPLPGRQKQRGE